MGAQGKIRLRMFDLKRGSHCLKRAQLFLKKIEEVCAKHVSPKKTMKLKKNIIPKTQQVLFRKRSKLSKKIKQTNSVYKLSKLLLKLHKIERELIEGYKSKRLDLERNAIQNMKQDPKAFYNYTRKFSKTPSIIGPFINNEGQYTSVANEMAEMLSQQYKSMFSKPDVSKVVQDNEAFFYPPHNPNTPKLLDILFCDQDIVKAIDELSATSAPGPDGVPAELLIKCKMSLSTPIQMIWRNSLDCGCVPNMLKQAEITPIHKGGSKALPKNYRPISLTSHITKIFERVIRKHIVKYLEDNGYMNSSQHGFRSGRSCLSQLLEHYKHILDAIEYNTNIDVIYLDFAKAFDKVDHGILAHKLRKLGITGKLGQWIHSFLTNRTQQVKVHNTLSSLVNVLSSVPQGIVLGPILFLVLISDINIGVDINTHVSSFADDTRVSRITQNDSDVDQLQCDLNEIYKWQKVNNMEFNSAKFELLRYGNNTEIKNTTHYKSPQNDTIQAKCKTRDLGIMVNNSATFTDHIEKVCSKCTQLCGWVYRTFISRDVNTMKMLWTSFIQPQLDYCSQLWAPHKQCHIQQLEGIQRTYTSRIPSISHLNYWERLSYLNMTSVQRRMERYRIIYVWKSLENYVPNFGVTAYTNIRKGRLCKLIPLNTRSPQYAQTIKENSIFIKGPQLFNRMPQEIRDLTRCSVLTFKYKLDAFLRTVPDEPRCPGYTQLTAKESNSILNYITM